MSTGGKEKVWKDEEKEKVEGTKDNTETGKVMKGLYGSRERGNEVEQEGELSVELNG